MVKHQVSISLNSLFSFKIQLFDVLNFFSVRERRDIGQRIVLLENRLDGVMVQFNATLAQNTNVRTEIDHLVQVSCNIIPSNILAN